MKLLPLPYKMVPLVQFKKQPVDSGPGQSKAGLPALAKEKDYEVRAPVESGLEDEAADLAVEIFDNIEIGISLNRLFSMSPKLLKQAKSILSRKRVTPRIREALQQALNDMELNHHSTSGNGLVEPIPGLAVDSTPVYLKDFPFTLQTKIMDKADGLIPMGAVVVNNAIVQYWLSIPEGEAPK
jgi:hypothetical protein